jgi:hypothetical protein
MNVSYTETIIELRKHLTDLEKENEFLAISLREEKRLNKSRLKKVRIHNHNFPQVLYHLSRLKEANETNLKELQEERNLQEKLKTRISEVENKLNQNLQRRNQTDPEFVVLDTVLSHYEYIVFLSVSPDSIINYSNYDFSHLKTCS